MNFSNNTLAYEDLRYCTLITKNGTKIVVNIDSLEFPGDSLPKFGGCIMGVRTVEPNASYEDYCRKDVEILTDLYATILNSTYDMKDSKTNYIPEIKNVIFNDPATIVFWEDGTKTVVKCQDGDEFDPEKGLAMAIVKKAYGNKGGYCNKLKKWLPKEEPVDSNDILSRIFETKVFPVNPDRSEFLASNDNSVSPKKRMTFREEVAKLRPERINPIHQGGVFGCPRDMEACPYILGASEDDCRDCWDREIPDELMNND